MLLIEQEVTTKAKPEAIWELYRDTTSWPVWDEGIDYVYLEGPFEMGTHGTLKPKGGPAVRFVMTEVDPYHFFSDISFLPLTQLIFFHRLVKDQDQVRVIHRVEMKGWLAPLFMILVGRKIKAGLKDAMEKLVKMAETGGMHGYF